MNWILRLFHWMTGIQSPQKPREDVTDEDIRDMLLGKPKGEKERLPSDRLEEEDTDPTLYLASVQDQVKSLLEHIEWTPPKLPVNRKGVYAHYGSPVKARKDSEYRKARMVVAKGLDGRWNNSSKKLYVHELFEPILRTALWLTKMVMGYVPIDQLGCYSHRNIQHKKNTLLSFHSWGIALDVDHADNRGVWRFKEWQRKVLGKWVGCAPDQAKRGPVTLPYDKTWLETWPDGIPYPMLVCFLATGMSWGATWSFPNDEWMYFVEAYGVGYDPEQINKDDKTAYETTLRKWQKQRYIDPMHLEAVDRQP